MFKPKVALAEEMTRVAVHNYTLHLWRMIWAKNTYRNDSRRNPAVAGF